VLFQSLRSFILMPANLSQYIVGSLVNLSLIVAAVIVGMEGGLVISVVAPLIAFFQGFQPNLIMVPMIAIGNIVLVVVVATLYRKNKLVALASAAILKFIALYIAVVKIALPVFLADSPDAMKAALSLNFSWPQLVTAAIGGVLALAVMPLIKKAIKE
ncbi:MAG TPA: ECF transporter S component, partial [Bacillota bacterium]|nr:ECF transporter S component [Bacillota bacterium]